MKRFIYVASCMFIAATFIMGNALMSDAPAQRDRFITVEGPDLKSRIDAAIRQARSRGPFWTAYSFDVRPGVAVDVQLSNFHGSTITFSRSAVSIGTSSGITVETRNLGIFLLHTAAGDRVTRVEVYNLEREREYSGYPVYWLGRAGNEESLDLLKGLVGSNQTQAIVETSTMSIGLHDDARVAGILKDFIGKSNREGVRGAAVFWLGQIGGEQPFLADLVRSEQETTSIRKKAAFAIGASKDETSLAVLRDLYRGMSNRELKKQLIFAISINNDEDGSVNFLIDAAKDDSDREARKQAIFWLGQKAGKRALEALGNTLDSRDADTEVQKQAVFAISQRNRDEAVPLLIKIARTHPKGEVRKQAIFWLGQTGDERALEFFKEILLK